jgi:hypothetical protein
MSDGPGYELGESSCLMRESGKAENTIALLQCVDTEGNMFNDAGHVPSRRERWRADDRGDAFAFSGLAVDWVNASGVHFHGHFGENRRRFRYIADFENFWATEFGYNGCAQRISTSFIVELSARRISGERRLSTSPNPSLAIGCATFLYANHPRRRRRLRETLRSRYGVGQFEFTFRSLSVQTRGFAFFAKGLSIARRSRRVLVASDVRRSFGCGLNASPEFFPFL